ncbi:MAG: hypothetical protein V2J02_17655, partial [Pseudomonadales bacterium]|nr:hypothetical protein [Pseudomonadales bacterium]
TIEELYGMIASAAGVEPWKLRIPAPPVQLLGEIVERICRPLGIEPPIYRRRVDFFTKARSFDCSRAARELGFRPRYTLEEEIALILESYRSLALL